MSGETYFEGECYQVTFKNRSKFLAFYEDAGNGFRLNDGAGLFYPVGNAAITDIVGPLRVVEPGQVVLDLKGLDAGEYLHDLRAITYDRAPAMSLECVAYIADQIEAQTKPPRIPEPGFGAVVEAGVETRTGRFLFTRVVKNGTVLWQSQDGVSELLWDSLVDPVVKREAVES